MRNPIEIIEDLQQKPEHIRRGVAVVATLSVMAVIMGLWITSFSVQLGGVDASADALQAGAPSPFALMWNFVKESVR